MASKTILLLLQALLLQFVASQYLGPGIGPGLPGPYGIGPGAIPFGVGCNAAAVTGGGFPVTSASPIAPTGVTIVSENAIEGALTVGGNLPLLGSVTVDGAFPTAGAGAISYGCGDGALGIVSESPIATGIVGSRPVGPGALGSRFGAGLAGSCGHIY